jgi:hypothetical protein
MNPNNIITYVVSKKKLAKQIHKVDDYILLKLVEIWKVYCSIIAILTFVVQIFNILWKMSLRKTWKLYVFFQFNFV